mmetsp:Transcript_61579/g.193024  ORF Transcript_61579/g.193024 Transcript_61579/m.193024 type:complete len:229 (-) Transcript_61579:583-1269(-)
MASPTAARPSFAVLMASRFCVRSAARWTSVEFSVLLRLAMEVLSCPISASRVSFLAFSWPSSAESFLVSANLKSRFFVALPTSVSQKPFLVASCVDSARRRSMSLWMSVFTFRKGSADARAAREASEVLLKRPLSVSRNSRALPSSCCWRCSVVRASWPRLPIFARFAAPARCAFSRLPCRKEKLPSSGRVLDAVDAALVRGRLWNWTKALLLTVSAAVTFPFKMVSA